MLRRIITPAILMLVCSVTPVSAGESHETLYDQFSLQASAQSEVENDLMRVSMQVQHDDRDAAVLAGRVNTDMQWAIEQLAPFETIEYKTENYTTYPKYEQQRVVGWRSSQALSLSSGNFESVKKAVQILQGRLQVRNMVFLPRDETRRLAEDKLINDALDNLKHRAGIVQQNMGADGYRIMHMNIDTGHQAAIRPRMEVAMMRSNRAEVAPAVEGGNSKISVTVSGQIQLQ